MTKHDCTRSKAINLVAAGTVPTRFRNIFRSTIMIVHITLTAGHSGLEGSGEYD